MNSVHVCVCLCVVRGCLASGGAARWLYYHCYSIFPGSSLRDNCNPATALESFGTMHVNKCSVHILLGVSVLVWGENMHSEGFGLAGTA